MFVAAKIMGSSSYQKILEIFRHLAVVALTPIESDKVLDSLNFLDFLVEEQQEADELIMRVITSDSTTDTCDQESVVPVHSPFTKDFKV